MGNLTYESVVSSIYWVRSTEVALVASNCDGEVYFQVGDAYGGVGFWELIK